MRAKYLNPPARSLLGLPLFQETKIKILGIPFDSGQTFNTGSRFAPHYIRLASDSIEEYSLMFNEDVRRTNASDWGDIIVSFGDFDESRKRFEEVIRKVRAEKYVFIGGDHTVTLFPIYFFRGKIRKYIHLDAHADFEHTYLGSKYNHDCVLRRIGEILGWENIILAGVRSVSEKALSELKKLGVEYYTTFDIENQPDLLCDLIKRVDYVSIDMDLFDPAYAPEVGNPEPLGLNPKILFKCITHANPIFVDIVEVTASSIVSPTAILAATILREMIIVMNH